ncbi:disease resistance protein RPV1-like [Pyrus x bretschneideri]|uniref:disease resistance protein RPV1-like n=1 Tax=Pyrus x bretschneideri TaxID=225117 RepID=UPI002030C825|nr:disease resistance protein RPV1-like [Pyrus x bretschneideri]
MGLIGFIQDFNIIIIAIGTLLHMFCKLLTLSSSPSSAADSDVAHSTAVAHSDIPQRRKKYDVFISFRGEDTRNTFTSHLYDALLQKKIDTYIDRRLERGEQIGPALRKAIQKSKLWVIIFSQNYASSTWCLDELVHILKCNKRGNRRAESVIPIFYHTDPSDVRKQRGSYAAAFAIHEKRFKDNIDKVHKWRGALTDAANVAGFQHSENTWTDADLVKIVVKDIWTKLSRHSSCNLKGLVGIESRIEQIESLLGIHLTDHLITVGIWGMGGIGKTTLAKAVFRKHSSKFEASCFLENVTEREQKDGLKHLQNKLLEELFKGNEVMSIGVNFVNDMLGQKKVLIVLDDVSEAMQIVELASHRLQYGTGSRIIFTSRDRSILKHNVVEDQIYKVEGLKPNDALKLFRSYAFKNTGTSKIDYELVDGAVAYAGGVPLALILLGSSFLNCKSKEAWENELDKLKQFPNENILRVWRPSYDRLTKIDKNIFLDIACFHKKKKVKEVEKMLAIHGGFPATRIGALVDMSLISIDSKSKTIEMLDLVERMGRAIVREECIEDSSKRSRMFNDEDASHVLECNTITPNVEAILVNWSKIEERSLTCANFKVMSNLRLLIVDNCYKITTPLELPDSLSYLYWPKYPLESLPSKFSSKNLVELHMPNSKVKKLWKKDQRPVNLQVIDLSNSRNLTRAPNLSRSRKLVSINLNGCSRLVEIPGGIQHLDKLTHLDLGDCSNLKYLPKMPGNIQYLDLQGSGIKELPKSVWSNKNISYLKSLDLSRTAVKELHSSIGSFPALKRLQLQGCERLLSIPETICKLKCLEKLDLKGCSSFSKFPEILEPMEHLVSLSLEGTAVEMLPSSFRNLIGLQTLDLSGCKHLKVVDKSIYLLTKLKRLNFKACRELERLPSSSERFPSLEVLDLSDSGILEIPDGLVRSTSLKRMYLSGTKIRSIPASIKQASRLSELNIVNCKWLQSLPELPMQCNVEAEGCAALKRVASSRNKTHKQARLLLF